MRSQHSFRSDYTIDSPRKLARSHTGLMMQRGCKHVRDAGRVCKTGLKENTKIQN